MDEFEVGTTVITPYGLGEIQEIRNETQQLVLRLASGGTAYIQANLAKKKKKLFEMTNEEKLAQSKIHREEGNMFFKLGDFGLAVQKYEIAKVYLRQLDVPNKPEMLSLLNNIALASIKAGNYADAVQACTDGINDNFSNGETLNAAEVKCYYLRGQANRKRGDLESALTDFQKAIKAAPQNKSIREEYESLVRELRSAKEKEASMYKKAFEANAKIPDPSDDSQKKNKVDNAKQAENTPVNAAPAPASTNSASTEAGDNKINPENKPKSFLEEYGTTLLLGAGAACLVLLAMSRGK